MFRLFKKPAADAIVVVQRQFGPQVVSITANAWDKSDLKGTLDAIDLALAAKEAKYQAEVKAYEEKLAKAEEAAKNVKGKK